jgi:hypothetical protein
MRIKPGTVTSAEPPQDIKERRFSIAVLLVGGFKPPLLDAATSYPAAMRIR